MSSSLQYTSSCVYPHALRAFTHAGTQQLGFYVCVGNGQEISSDISSDARDFPGLTNWVYCRCVRVCVLKPAVIRRPDATHRTVSTTHDPPPSIGLMAPPVHDADDIHLLIRDLVESGSLPDLCYAAGALSVYRLNDARLYPGQYASWAVASIPFSRRYLHIHMIKCDGAYLYWFVTSTCPIPTPDTMTPTPHLRRMRVTSTCPT